MVRPAGFFIAYPQAREAAPASGDAEDRDLTTTKHRISSWLTPILTESQKMETVYSATDVHIPPGMLEMSNKALVASVYAASAGTASSGTAVAWLSPSLITSVIGAICAIIGATVAVKTYLLNKEYKEKHYQLAKEKTSEPN